MHVRKAHGAKKTLEGHWEMQCVLVVYVSKETYNVYNVSKEAYYASKET